MLTEWNDGCNECQVNTIPGGGLELGACTERFCFAPGDAFCMERGGGLAGGASVAPPPRHVVNYSEDAARDAERLREEERAAREAKAAAEAELKAAEAEMRAAQAALKKLETCASSYEGNLMGFAIEAARARCSRASTRSRTN